MSEVQAPCAYHAGNAASHVCERCGDFMCALCTTPIEGRLYCTRCFDLLYTRGALELTQRQFTLPNVTLGLGIAALFTGFLCVGIPLGIVGIAAGMGCLKEFRKRPELPNRAMAQVGIGLSVVGILIGVIVIVAGVMTLRR